jgi:HEPN domain-containing protein
VLRKDDLRAMAERRLGEAAALLAAGYWSGAYYLSGYVVELSLKSVIAGTFVASAIPDRKFVNDVYTHNLADLVKHAGLEPALKASSQSDLQFAAYWEVAKTWREDSRYRDWTEAEARTMVEAIADRTSGVLTWIRANW